MADTTVTSPSVKKYVDYSQQQVDEQAILDKYNAATVAQYNLQREQNRAAENQFYNKMYNTQKTAMDTIRQSNAAAVASGASRGVQAANELAAILGLQQESVQGATEIAQANRQTAQEETAAVLENVLNAYNQATQERQTLVQQGIEAASVDVQEAANQIAAQEAATNRMNAETNRLNAESQKATTEQTKRDALQSAAETGLNNYLTELHNQGKDYATEHTAEGAASLELALNTLTKTIAGGNTLFNADDWAGSSTGANKARQVEEYVKQVCATYGIQYTGTNIETMVNNLISDAGVGASFWGVFTGDSKTEVAQRRNDDYTKLLKNIRLAYKPRQ